MVTSANRFLSNSLDHHFQLGRLSPKKLRIATNQTEPFENLTDAEKHRVQPLSRMPNLQPRSSIISIELRIIECPVWRQPMSAASVVTYRRTMWCYTNLSLL
jgi:hypothetical protein